MAVLGPERAIVMGLDARIDNLNGEKSKLEDMQILLIAGAPPARYDGDWMEKAEATITGLPLPTQEHAASTILADIVGKGTPVRRDGFEVSWNQMSLAMLANTVLVGWQGYKPSTNWDAAKGFFGALGNNPGAAAIAFGGHPEEYLEVGKSHPVGAFGIGFEDSNVSFIIGAVGAGGENQYFTDETRVVFGEIAGKYWNGLEKSATARWAMVDDPSLPGVERPFKEWENFLLEGMRNPETANRVLALFEGYKGGTAEDGEFPTTYKVVPVLGPDGKSMLDESGNAMFSYVPQDDNVADYLHRQFGGDMITVRDGLLEKLINERTEDLKNRNEAADSLVDELFGLAEDPKGWAAGKGKDAIKQIIQNAITLKDGDLTALEAMRSEYEAKDLSNWEDQARKDFDSKDFDPKNPDSQGPLPPVRVGESGGYFTGNPRVYEQQVEAQFLAEQGNSYGGQSVNVRITDGNGNIRPIEELRADPLAYRAYLAWLQDPAVQSSVYAHDDFVQRGH